MYEFLDYKPWELFCYEFVSKSLEIKESGEISFEFERTKLKLVWVKK
jgi:hypothetical protein